MKKYKELRAIAEVLNVIGWLVIATGIVGAIIALAVGGDVTRIGLLIGQAFGGLVFLAISELAKVLMDIEENTRPKV